MDNAEIRPHAVYTTKEAEVLLRISQSTLKRLLKKGLLKANKVGRQYRILGREIIRLVSPNAEKPVFDSYQKLKSKVVSRINKW